MPLQRIDSRIFAAALWTGACNALEVHRRDVFAEAFVQQLRATRPVVLRPHADAAVPVMPRIDFAVEVILLQMPCDAGSRKIGESNTTRRAPTALSRWGRTGCYRRCLGGLEEGCEVKGKRRSGVIDLVRVIGMTLRVVLHNVRIIADVGILASRTSINHLLWSLTAANPIIPSTDRLRVPHERTSGRS